MIVRYFVRGAHGNRRSGTAHGGAAGQANRAMRSYVALARIRRIRLFVLGLCSLVALLTQQVDAAQAHPMGNFSINMCSLVVIRATQIDILYVVDMAEIPTFQAFGGGRPTPAEQRTFLVHTIPTLRGGLRLFVDGRQDIMHLDTQKISFPPGQAGLPLTRVELRFSAPIPRLSAGTPLNVRYSDVNYAGRIGWHEIVALPARGAALLRSDVPAVDPTNALRVYPQDMLSSPLDVRAADLVVGKGSGASALPAGVQQRGTTRPVDAFAALITSGNLTPLALIVALMTAFGLGALHALSPGHGKSVMAAYLVGSRGTARHAFYLGFTVTATHTLGVFALGGITLYAAQFVKPEQLYPWLGLISGLLVFAMGLTLLKERVRHFNLDHQDEHHHHDHGHTHPHPHPHMHSHGAAPAHAYHGHEHSPAGESHSPLSLRGLLALGISGGLVPCPTALVVMLSAIALQRIGFGLILIVMFSLGLASMLMSIGLLFVFGARRLQQVHRRRLPRLAIGLRLVPILSALIVTTVGLTIAVQAMSGTGL
jgi:nickel/cobalt transporter (NicO) family protein